MLLCLYTLFTVLPMCLLAQDSLLFQFIILPLSRSNTDKTYPYCDVADCNRMSVDSWAILNVV